MTKHIWRLAAGGLVILASGFGGSAYWAGIKAEKTLAEQHRIVAGLSMFKVKNHSYQRGWFSSTEVTELELNPEFIGPYLSLLPEQSRNLANVSLRYTNHVDHGPLPELSRFGFKPAQAVVRTEFEMSPETRKTLKRFFGDAEPITVTNRLYLTGGGELQVLVPKFEYEEPLAGVKINWQGFTAKVDYESGYSQYGVDARLPGLMVDAATKGHVELDGLNWLSNTRPGQTGVKLGASELSIGRVRMDSRESIPYEIRLNELVYLLTRVRVGEFINPSGEFKPSTVELKDLHYQISTSEQDEFINTRGKLDFATLSINQKAVGPLKLDIAATHLHGPTLVKLDAALTAIPFNGADPAALRKQYVDTVLKEGLPLLTANPRLIVNEFTLKLPEGEVKLNGQLALNGLVDADLKKPIDFLGKVDAEAALSVPRPTLEDLVVAQARNLFVVDATAENAPNVEDIDELARNLLATQLSTWKEQRFITMNGEQIDTKMEWKGGKLLVNQHPVLLPWQEMPPELGLQDGEPAAVLEKKAP